MGGEKMNMKYMSPDIEIVLLNTSDVISTSNYGKDEEDHGGFGGEWNDW